MNYIILDLEWNQSPDGKEHENRKLPFEIVEIGAVKLDSELKEIDRYHSIIAPVVYKSLHHVTKEIIKFTMDELKKGKPFKEAATEFFKWCEDGGEYIFGIWGSMDLTELQRNCKYHNVEYNFPYPFVFYDIQKLYSKCYSDGKSRIALETAVTEQNMTKDIEFHSAYDDAVYTARIFQHMDFNKFKIYTSIDTYRIPTSRKDEIVMNYGEYTKYISRGFSNKDLLMRDGVVISTRCCECDKNLRKKVRWFATSQKKYYCLAFCEEHGYMKGTIKIRKNSDNKYYATKILKAASKEDTATIKQKQLNERIKRRKRRQKRSFDER